MTDTPSLTDRILDAALPHVVFDGWSPATFDAALRDSGVDPAVAGAVVPRGAVDLALGFHARGDATMVARLGEASLDTLRFRDRVALAVRLRLDAVTGDKEAVRRGVTLFAQPQYASDGARAIWGTADAIWTALGDTSEDVNWYTKRASLSAVYGAVVLFWLGDDSEGHAATWEFLDRRIDDVMQVEKLKADLRGSVLFKPLMAGPEWLAAQIRAPKRDRRQGMPGSTGAQRGDQ